MPLQKEQWDKLLRLRGFLAFYVLLHHVRNILWPRLSEVPSGDGNFYLASLVVNILGEWGLFAVLAFFVVSGFSIGIAYRRKFQITRFWKARLRRLYPALLFSLVIAAVCYFLIYRNFQGQGINLIATLLFQNGLTFGAAFGANTPYWSLACEGFYYFAFPLIFAGTYGFGRVLLVAFASLSLYFLLEPAHSIMALLYFPIWLAGLYASMKTDRSPSAWLAVLGVAAGLLGMLAHIYLDYKEQLDSLLGLIVTMASGFTMALLVISLIQIPRNLPFRTIRHFLGDISYSLYLVHYPILLLIRKYLPGSSLGNSLLTSVVAIAACLVVATFTYRFFEHPFLKNRATQ